MSKIYNKNAREKSLLEEAYTGVYKEGAVDVELESWWEYDPHDVVVKVYHGALHAMPPAQGTPEYERNFEKIFTWLEGKYPQHSEDGEDKDFRDEQRDQDPHRHKGLSDFEAEQRDQDPHRHEDEDAEGVLGNLAKGIGRGLGDVASGVGRVGLAAGGAGVAAAGGALGAAINIAKTLTADQLKALGEYALEKAAGGEEDAEMEFDERGFVKNTEAGYEREGDHDKFVKIAHEALEMIKDELHIGGHGEDININELTDGHNQLSRALIALLGEEQAIDIMGGQAERQAQAEQDFKPAYGEY
jgi:hypothetical protein